MRLMRLTVGRAPRWTCSTVPASLAFRPTFGAIHLLGGILQGGSGILGPPPDPDLDHFLALLDRQQGDAERGKRVDFGHGRFDDVQVQLAEVFVAARRDAQQLAEIIEAKIWRVCPRG